MIEGIGMNISTIMIFVWLGIALLALIVELNTTDLSSIWATAGGIITMIVAIFCHIIWLQIVIFIVVTLLGLLLVRPYIKRYVGRNEIKTNSDALVGKTATVNDDIIDDNIGSVHVDGKEWSAINKDGTGTISKGEKVEIVAIEGVKLIVKVKE